MFTPLVSILIPCYNSAKYIAETLDSVIAQTYTHWECIVVDDHSADGSVAVVQEYCNRYPGKIKLFTNPRKGACAARNVAFEHCSGEYIQYLDADDLLSETKIEEQMKLFAIFGNSVIISGLWGRFYQSMDDVKWEQQSINRDYKRPTDWLADSWIGGGMAQTSVWLTPRALVVRAGAWDESLLINQDGEFFCRVLLQANEVKFCGDARVYYRSGMAGSVSKSKITEARAASLLKSYNSYERVLAQRDDIIVRKALGNNYLNYMYAHYNTHKLLAYEAEKYFHRLNAGKMWPVGGGKFKIFAKLIGFKNALRLRGVR